MHCWKRIFQLKCSICVELTSFMVLYWIKKWAVFILSSPWPYVGKNIESILLLSKWLHLLYLVWIHMYVYSFPTENWIDGEAFGLLDESTIKDLISKVGPRLKFLHHFNQQESSASLVEADGFSDDDNEYFPHRLKHSEVSLGSLYPKTLLVYPLSRDRGHSNL